MTPANRIALPTWLRLMAIFQIGFAMMIGIGASFEVLNLTMPEWFPLLQENPIARIHHDEPVVFAWTLGSNIVVAGIAIAFSIGGMRILHGAERGRGLTRIAAASLIAISIGGAIVSVVYLLPIMLPELDASDESSRANAIIFISMLVSSVVVLPAYPIAALVILGRRSVKALFR